MENHILWMDSWKTSNSTITLRELRQLGISNADKYIPKAHEIVPPYTKKLRLPRKNMVLTIVTDTELFLDYHDLNEDEEEAAENMDLS